MRYAIVFRSRHSLPSWVPWHPVSDTEHVRVISSSDLYLGWKTNDNFVGLSTRKYLAYIPTSEVLYIDEMRGGVE